MKQEDYVFLWVEEKDDKESRHKLPLIAEGRYPVKDVNMASKKGIERDDRSMENVPRSHVTLPQMLRSADELLEDTRPQTDKELGTGVPISEEANMNELVTQKKKPPTKQTEVEEQQSDSDDE